MEVEQAADTPEEAPEETMSLSDIMSQTFTDGDSAAPPQVPQFCAAHICIEFEDQLMPTEDKDEMEEMVSGVEGIYLREPSEEEAQERESQQEEPQVTPEGEWTSEALEGLSQYVQHDNAVQTWTNYFDVIGGPTSKVTTKQIKNLRE